MLGRSEDGVSGLDAVGTRVVRRGMGCEEDARAGTAHVMDSGQDVQREAARRAGQALQRAEASVDSVAKVVDEELQPHRKY